MIKYIITILVFMITVNTAFAADSSVQESDGDFTTLNAALADAGTGDGDTITISGTWSAVDSGECTVADDNITIIATGSSSVTTARHVAGSPDHYRLHTPASGDGGHCITVNNTGCEIDGLDIKQASTGSSDECIRIDVAGTFTLKNSILWSSRAAVDQDAIHLKDTDTTINLENSINYAFTRAGMITQFSLDTVTHTININSCGFFDCGQDSELAGGGISIEKRPSGYTANINVHNTFVLDCNFDSNDDYNEFTDGGDNATATWGISYSIDSDNSIAGRDGGGSGNLASRTIRDSTAGGNEVLVNDITGSAPFDLSLIDDDTNNDAQDAHTTDTAESLTVPATDIDGTSRPQNTSHDIGAFEIVVGGEPPSETTQVIFIGQLMQQFTSGFEFLYN